MKNTKIIYFLFLLFIVFSVNNVAKDNANRGFEKLKSLAGTWQSKMPDGSITTISYKIVSNGSTIMETISSKKEDGMVTMYHLNNNNLMMTHYCSAGNQPRMKAKFSKNNKNKINFRYIDATNIKSEKDGHMLNLDITFKDKNHITHDWTWTKDGKNTVFTFNAERVK